MTSHDLGKFKKGLEELRISLDPGQFSQFKEYYELLEERNKTMNLTAITDFNDVVEKHFLDSLCLVKVFPELSEQRILDLGTGAGFPGIPLKIAFPGLDMLLLDSLNKRVLFLNEVIERIRLKKIVALHGRAEEEGQNPEYRERFDICVSRAVANLAVLSEYCLPFVKTGGHFVSYKSSGVIREVEESENAIFLMGGAPENLMRFRIPESDKKRTMFVVRKKDNTPHGYPRRVGVPRKNPIKW